jgi:ABC-type phosphate/phosphonate transport system substrate-binding protein
VACVFGRTLPILAFIGLIGLPQVDAQAPPEKANPNVKEIKIGFPEPMFKDVAPNLIQVAAKPFQEMLQKIAGITGTMEVVPDYKVLADLLDQGKLDMAVFHGFEYAWVKDTPGLEPIVVTVPNCGKVQACLVVHVDSKAKAPNQLTGACVAVPKGSKAHCQMFLERIRENLPDGCCCPINQQGMTPAETLDAVVCRNCEAALVDISALLAYQKSTPGLARQLKVLQQSELLPSAVVVYRKGALTPQQVAAIRGGLLNSTKTAEGQIFAMFWNLKGFGEVSDEYHKLVDQCLLAYPPPGSTTRQTASLLPQAPAPRSK